MAKYRKKPVVIDAEQYFEKQLPWPEGVHKIHQGPHPDHYIIGVSTLEGSLACTDGDWIITGVKGEKYPCKPDIFEATYELVENTKPLARDTA